MTEVLADPTSTTATTKAAACPMETLAQVIKAPATVRELAHATGACDATVRNHLGKAQQAGLVDVVAEREGPIGRAAEVWGFIAHVAPLD